MWGGVSSSALGRGLERGCAPPQVWEGGFEEVMGRKRRELVMVILSRVWVYTPSGGEGVGCGEGVSPSKLGIPLPTGEGYGERLCPSPGLGGRF